MKILKSIGILLLGINLLACQSNKEQQNIEPIGKEVKTPSTKSDCCTNCITFIKKCKGISLPSGDLTTIKAKEGITNKKKDEPCQGCVVVLNNGFHYFNSDKIKIYTGHLAYVQKFDSEKIYLHEGNYLNSCGYDRSINRNDPRISGYYKP